MTTSAADTPTALHDRLAATLRDVPDFPKPGIRFKDITPVLAQPLLMREVIDVMCAPHVQAGITHVVAVESRGFLFGMPMALQLGVSFAPARKPGKLPWRTTREEYALEYRSDIIEMHEDALAFAGDAGAAAAGRPRVLVVDDVLATGGTAAAACRLIERLGGTVAGVSVLVELAFLEGRARLRDVPVHAVMTY